MARPARPVTKDGFSTLFFDTGAVLAAARRDRRVQLYLDLAKRYGAGLHMSALTRAELMRGSDELAIGWAISNFRIQRVSDLDCVRAAELMAETGAGGRTVDALIAVAALQLPRPVVVLTSDPKDMNLLLAGQPDVAVVPV